MSFGPGPGSGPGLRLLASVLVVIAACDPTPSARDPGSVEPAAPLMERSVASAEPGRATATATSTPAPTPPSTSTPTPAHELAEVAYDRKLWAHWVDDDGDCQDTRTEVLLAESYATVGFEGTRECEIASGRWQCPYTGKLIREVHLLDVDHLVPLANAHRSGAGRWPAAKRRAYANDLEHPEHLIAVDYSANRSKADKGPEAWLPPSEEYRCTYVREWVGVKQRWGLSMSALERQAVADALEQCDAGGAPALPQTVAKPKLEPKSTAGPASGPSPSAGECCRVCQKGKACGDGCIAQTSTCSKAPGCACDG